MNSRLTLEMRQHWRTAEIHVLYGKYIYIARRVNKSIGSTSILICSMIDLPLFIELGLARGNSRNTRTELINNSIFISPIFAIFTYCTMYEYMQKFPEKCHFPYRTRYYIPLLSTVLGHMYVCGVPPIFADILSRGSQLTLKVNTTGCDVWRYIYTKASRTAKKINKIINANCDKIR